MEEDGSDDGNNIPECGTTPAAIEIRPGFNQQAALLFGTEEHCYGCGLVLLIKIRAGTLYPSRLKDNCEGR